MSKYRVGVIGCGDNTRKKGPQGYAMAWQHAAGYANLPEQCEMVACADLVEKNAKVFAERFGVKATYSDYKEMLATGPSTEDRLQRGVGAPGAGPAGLGQG